MPVPKNKKELEEWIAEEDEMFANGFADLHRICTSRITYKGKQYLVNGSQFIRWSKPELPPELPYKIDEVDDKNVLGGSFHGTLRLVDGITSAVYVDEDGNSLPDDFDEEEE